MKPATMARKNPEELWDFLKTSPATLVSRLSGPSWRAHGTSRHRAETNSLIQLRMIERGECLRFAGEALEAVRVG